MQEASRPGRRARVLVAEDDGDMRALLVSALREDGHLVIEAHDGFDLLRKLAELGATDNEQAVDLIVSDVRMPGPNGIEVLGILRRYSRSLPVVLITAFGDLATHSEAERLGAAAVFDKPFDVDDLRAAVRNLTLSPRP